MRRSRLESCENILETLVSKPLTLCSLASEAHVDPTLLMQYLDFLMRNGLVEERTIGNVNFYAITEKGLVVIKALNFQKYLRKIKGTIRAIDEALEIIPEISNQSDDAKKFSE